MYSAEWVSMLRGDKDVIDALTYIAERQEPYPTKRFIPPMRKQTNEAKETPFAALYFRIGRKHLKRGGSRITRIDGYDGCETKSCTGSLEEIAAWFAATYLTYKRRGWHLITWGMRRKVLDEIVASLGPQLVKLGYQIHPARNSTGSCFVKLKKGGRTWTICLLES